MRHPTMRLPRLLIVAFLFALAFPSVALAASEPPTPGDVIARQGIEDGDEVVIQGEAIGEVLRADGDHRWVNILGGGSAIGAYMPQEMADEIEYFGEYTTFGDTVQVRGTVNFACQQHGGEFDIHAEELTVVEPGGERENPFQMWRLFVGLGLIVVAFGQYRLFVFLKNRGPA